MLEQFEGAREAFSLVRQEIVGHAVAHGFVDLPADRMEIAGRDYVTMAIEVVMPRIDEACREARAAGISAARINDQVAVTMNDFTAMLQDSLRECGLNIQIVSGEIQGPRKEILAKKSWQRNPGKEILAKKSWQRNPGKEGGA